MNKDLENKDLREIAQAIISHAEAHADFIQSNSSFGSELYYERQKANLAAIYKLQEVMRAHVHPEFTLVEGISIIKP